MAERHPGTTKAFAVPPYVWEYAKAEAAREFVSPQAVLRSIFTEGLAAREKRMADRQRARAL